MRLTITVNVIGDISCAVSELSHYEHDEELEAELEAFMWAILEKIRIRASADQAEFLLGLG